MAIETASGDGVPFVGGDTDIMKLFGGNANRYAWSSNSALDHNDARYDLTAGDYVLLVRGRSRGLKIDRIILYNENADQDAAKNAPETPYITPPGEGGSGGVGGVGGSDSSGSGGESSGSGNGGAPGAGGADGASSGDGGSNSADASGSDADGGCSIADMPARDGLGWLWLAAGLVVARRRRRG